MLAEKEMAGGTSGSSSRSGVSLLFGSKAKKEFISIGIRVESR
jgi:hypothetical protein